MPTRPKQSPRSAADPNPAADEPEDEDVADAGPDESAEVDAETTIEDEPEAEPEDEATVEADDIAEADEPEDDTPEEAEEAEVEIVAPVRPAGRPSPGRPPSAKEEPEPPFFIGERVRLVRNTRPRTGSPIADHPVGATGRVETVLSQTAIVRFDRALDTKEVVAFTCLESLDEEAMARRAERDRQAAKG